MKKFSFLRKYKSLSLQQKLTVWFAVTACLPIIVLGFSFFYNARDNMNSSVMNSMNSNLNQINTDLEGRIQRETDFTKFIAYNVKFRELLENNAFDNVTIAQEMNKQWDPTFWYFLTSDVNIKSVHIYTPKLNQRVGSFLYPSKDTESEDWYLYQQTNFETNLWADGDKVYSTRTILGTGKNIQKVQGVIYTEYFTEKLLEPLISSSYLSNGYILTDQNGKVIINRKLENEVAESEAENFAKSKVTEVSGQNTLFVSKNLGSTGWKISYYIDKSEMGDLLEKIINKTLIYVSLCLVLCFLIISFVASKMSKRLLKLKKIINGIEAGNLDQNISSSDKDEIGIVTNSIGKMSRRLSFLINEVYKNELEVLQAKINPHFLYNCLSAIKWKALETDSNDISDMTGLLAKFYRTSLNNGEMITSVANEIENIRSYTQILKLTHDDCFDITFNIEEKCKNYKMLNFLLQPIVENAFNHGIKQTESDDRGFILINAHTENNKYIVFSVINSGPAINVTSIDELLSKESSGYGIKNVAARIKLYYGSDCGIKISLTEDGNTCFTIKILTEIKDTENLSNQQICQ